MNGERKVIYMTLKEKAKEVNPERVESAVFVVALLNSNSLIEK